MTQPALRTLRSDQVGLGDALPPLEVDVTATSIVAGAIASRDYQEVHHDAEAARRRGSPDIFMNILTTNGYIGRFVTDWAGPEACLCRVEIRLGVPNHPGDRMRLEGRVTAKEGRRLCVEVEGRNARGAHVTGRVELELPA
jgi:acyl dehydratase